MQREMTSAALGNEAPATDQIAVTKGPYMAPVPSSKLTDKIYLQHHGFSAIALTAAEAAPLTLGR